MPISSRSAARRIDLPVAVTRDQHFGAMARIVAFYKRRHEMLTMPHSDYRRHLGFVIDVRRLQGHAGSCATTNRRYQAAVTPTVS